MIAGRFRALSLLRADRACVHLAAVQVGTNTRVEVQILIAMEVGPSDLEDGGPFESVHLRFLADARKALLVQSPHVDRTLHVGVTDDGHPFVVREPQAAHSQTLAALLEKRGSLPTEAAVDVAVAVCAALESAHAHGLVHTELDTSAVQVVWTPSGPSMVKVVGLGTSRALALLSIDGRALSALAIRAPERLSSDCDLDARADIWGVGVLLHTMLAGSPPFTAEAPATVDVSAALDEPALLAGVPDGLADLVDACLSRNPVLRPQSAGSLGTMLAAFGTPAPAPVRTVQAGLPVFEKRASTLVVDTGPYDALVLERLVKEAVPGGSEQSIEVEFSVPDLAQLAKDEPAPLEATPEPMVVTASVPPVAFSVLPPPPASPAPPARVAAPFTKRRTTMMVAAACLAMGVLAIGAVTMRASASRALGASPSRATPALTAEAPPPAVELSNVPAAPAAAAPIIAPPPKVATLAVSELPSIAAPRGRAPAPRAGAKARAAEPVAAPAPAAPAAASVDPVVQSAAAPVQPQPKASDDDLRRFLDDRR